VLSWTVGLVVGVALLVVMGVLLLVVPRRLEPH